MKGDMGADRRATADQAGAQLRDLAPSLSGLYVGLRAVGHSRLDAAMMVATFIVVSSAGVGIEDTSTKK